MNLWTEIRQVFASPWAWVELALVIGAIYLFPLLVLTLGAL